MYSALDIISAITLKIKETFFFKYTVPINVAVTGLG